MADKTKDQIKAEFDALFKENQELKAQMEALQKKEGRNPSNPYLVEPPMPINSMSLCDRYSWRMAELKARLENKDLSDEQRAVRERGLIKHELKYIDAYQATEKKDPAHAKLFKKEVDVLLNKHAVELSKPKPTKMKIVAPGA